MTKRESKYQRIEAAKDRYRKLTSEKIWKILNCGYVNEEGQIAYRQILEERGQWPYGSEE